MPENYDRLAGLAALSGAFGGMGSGGPIGFGPALNRALQSGLGAYATLADIQRGQRLDELRQLEMTLKRQAQGREEEQRARRAKALADYVKGLKPSQRALVRAAPDIALRRLSEREFGAPKTPQVFGSAETGYYTLSPQGQPQRVVAGVPATTSSGGLTDSQQRFNAETMAARRQMEQLGIDRETALAASQEYLPNGLPNPDYNPNMASLVRTGMRRMYGDDPTHGALLSRIYGSAPGPAQPSPPTPTAPSQSPSIAQKVTGWVSDLFGEESAQAAPADTGTIHLGTGARTPAAGAGSAMPLPATGGRIDRSKLTAGTVYALPDGRAVRWSGSDFEVLGR